MTPLKTKLILQIEQESDRTSTGLYIPTSTSSYSVAKVLAVGDTVEDVSVGNRVLLRKGRGEPVLHKGLDCVVVDETVIEAILLPQEVYTSEPNFCEMYNIDTE